MAVGPKPIVLITGAAGNIGTALAVALQADYRVVGMDREGLKADFPIIAIDLTSARSVTKAFTAFRKQFGGAMPALSTWPPISTSPARTVRSINR